MPKLMHSSEGMINKSIDVLILSQLIATLKEVRSLMEEVHIDEKTKV